MITAIMLLVTLTAPPAEVFDIEQVFSIPKEARVSGENDWTYWSYFTVSPDGARAAFIDPSQGEVLGLDLMKGTGKTIAGHTDAAEYLSFQTTEQLEGFDREEYLRTVAGQGRGADQVNIPLAINYDLDGRLFIPDAGNRRVSIFDSAGSLEHSFLLPTDMDCPHEIHLTSTGYYLLANLRLDSVSLINSGHHCNLLSRSGALVKSFGYTPKAAIDKNIWLGVFAHTAMDEQGTIYVTFSVDTTIYRFSPEGDPLGALGCAADWWHAPPKLERPKFVHTSEPDGFYESWTRVIKLMYIGDNRLLRVAKTNGLVGNNNGAFVMDIVSTDGRTLAGGIVSDYLPVGVDRSGAVYLLAIDGSRLLRTTLAEGVPK